MKIRFRNIMILLVLFVGGSSCDSFLDVQPKGEVLEGDLLKDAKPSTGFMLKWGQRDFTGRI